MDGAHPESPCRRICTLDANRVCVGCRRSLSEIAAWPGMTAAEKHETLDRAAKREVDESLAADKIRLLSERDAQRMRSS